MKKLIFCFLFGFILLSCTTEDEPANPNPVDETTTPTTPPTNNAEKVLMVTKNDTVIIDVNLDGIKDFRIFKENAGPCTLTGKTETTTLRIFGIDQTKSFIRQDMSAGKNFLSSGTTIQKEVSGYPVSWNIGLSLFSKTCYVATGCESTYSYIDGSSYYSAIAFKVNVNNSDIIGWMKFDLNFETGVLNNITVGTTENSSIVVP